MKSVCHNVVFTDDPTDVEFPLCRQVLIPNALVGQGSFGRVFNLKNKYSNEVEKYIIKLVKFPENTPISVLLAGSNSTDDETLLQNLLYKETNSFSELVPFSYPFTYIFISTNEISDKGIESLKALNNRRSSSSGNLFKSSSTLEKDEIIVNHSRKDIGVLMEKCDYSFVRALSYMESKGLSKNFMNALVVFLDTDLKNFYDRINTKDKSFKHNDLHIENMMINIDKNDKITFKIIDFGLAYIYTGKSGVNNSEPMRKHLFGNNKDSNILFTEYPETDIYLLMFSVIHKLLEKRASLEDEIIASGETTDEERSEILLINQTIDRISILLENKTKLYKTTKKDSLLKKDFSMKESGVKLIVKTENGTDDNDVQELLKSIALPSIKTNSSLPADELIKDFYINLCASWNINNWRIWSFLCLGTKNVS